MTVARSVARAVASPVARATGDTVNGVLPGYPSLCNTNFVTFWTKTAVTTTGGQADVNGGTTATLITTSTTTSRQRLYRSSGVAGVRRVIAKAGTTSFLHITGGTTGEYAIFNLSTGSVLSQVSGTAAITPLKDNWFICDFTPDTAAAFIEFGVGESAANAIPGSVYLGTAKTLFLSGAEINGGCTA